MKIVNEIVTRFVLEIYLWNGQGGHFDGETKSTGTEPDSGVAGRMVSDFARKVDVRLPGRGNSDSHGARPVY